LNAEKIVESGYLYKRSSKLKNWKKRWFVLRGTKLAYYKNDKEYKLISVIDLSMIHQVGKVNVSRPNVFGIVTKPRTYYMQGTSEEEVDNWIKNIRELVKKFTTSSKEHHCKDGNELNARFRSHDSLRSSINSLASNKTNHEINHTENNNNNGVLIINNININDNNTNINTNNTNNNNNNNNDNSNNNTILNENTLSNNLNNNSDNNDNNNNNNNNNKKIDRNNSDKNTIDNNLDLRRATSKPRPILTSLSEMDNSPKVKFIHSASVVEYRTTNPLLPYSNKLGSGSNNCGRSTEIKSARLYDEKYNNNNQNENIRDDEYDSSEENLFSNHITGVNFLNDNVVIRQGYLFRQSSKYKTWKKRWFVLRNGNLTCYKNDKEYAVISITPLAETLDIIETEKPLGKSHKYCFKIITEGKTMILCSETEEECNNWISDLQRYHKIIQDIKEKHGQIE